MRIDPAGWPFITGPLAPAVALGTAGRATGRRGLRLAAWPLIGLSAYMALFFRDPDRRCDTTAPGPDEVLSPADGVVFLSVVDVHVNRSPYSGEVVESSYRPGGFLAAYRKESAHRNERSELWLQNSDGPTTRTVVFRQIVGVLARGIVTRTGPGLRLATGVGPGTG